MSKNIEFVLKELDKRGLLQTFFNIWIIKELPLRGYYGNMRILFGLSTIFKIQKSELSLILARKIKIKLLYKSKLIF